MLIIGVFWINKDWSMNLMIMGIIAVIVGSIGDLTLCCYMESEEPKNQDHSCIVETEYNYCPNCGFELKGEQ